MNITVVLMIGCFDIITTDSATFNVSNGQSCAYASPDGIRSGFGWYQKSKLVLEIVISDQDRAPQSKTMLLVASEHWSCVPHGGV